MDDLKRSNKVVLKKINFKSKRTESIPNEILDKFSVMELLNISDRTLKRYIKQGYLSCSNIDNHYYFLYSDILAMLERYKYNNVP